MKTRRNFVVSVPTILFTVIVGIVTVAGTIKAIEVMKKDAAEERAAESLKKRQAVEKAASIIGLCGLVLGVGVLAVKGGMGPSRTRRL